MSYPSLCEKRIQARWVHLIVYLFVIRSKALHLSKMLLTQHILVTWQNGFLDLAEWHLQMTKQNGCTREKRAWRVTMSVQVWGDLPMLYAFLGASMDVFLDFSWVAAAEITKWGKEEREREREIHMYTWKWLKHTIFWFLPCKLLFNIVIFQRLFQSTKLYKTARRLTKNHDRCTTTPLSKWCPLFRESFPCSLAWD